MGWPWNKPRVVGENETFVRLIAIASEDDNIKNQLITILMLDPFNRRSFLNTHLTQMKIQGAPQEFVEAIACLLNDAVAEKALQILADD